MVAGAPGMAALDMNAAEDAVVAHTREVVPGMVICGMEVRMLFSWLLHVTLASKTLSRATCARWRSLMAARGWAPPLAPCL